MVEMRQFMRYFILSVVMLLVNVQCDRTRFKGLGSPVETPPGQTSVASVEECNFYKLESAIINCYEQGNFFDEAIEKRKNIVGSACLQKAFSAVWGANFNPSPYVYNPESVKNTNFNWHFSFGNIQKGSPTAFPPNSIEFKYLNLLNQFQSSLDVNQMNQCLGGNYPFDGPTIIRTSHEMIKLKLLESDTFIKCYREQLERYREQKACPIL